ncbi:MAG: 3-oxoacyl-ACP reductase FabG [Firmicutes bacterium]|nr:3-oxoacyl-ACP reductase FabG [Bacillota bacterium]
MKLAGKVAVVTGSGQGLGRAYALYLAKEGASVGIVDLNGEKAEQVAGEIRATGGRAIAVRCDITREEETLRMAQAVLAEFGRIDVLINNAALFSTLQIGPFMELKLPEWNAVLAVQLNGMFLCTQAVIPIMEKQGGGKIINITSGTIFTGKVGYVHYLTSKAGVVGFTRALAKELGPSNITVNTLSPGAVVTEVQRETVSEERWQFIIKSQALRRKGTTDDLAKVAVFLASPESDWITGQMINVDGGMSLY